MSEAEQPSEQPVAAPRFVMYCDAIIIIKAAPAPERAACPLDAALADNDLSLKGQHQP